MMFHERTYAHFSEGITLRLAIIALDRGEGLQFARVPVGELRTHLCVIPFSGGRAMHVYDRLGFYIDEFRRFDRLNAVVRAVAVVLSYQAR